MLSVSFRPLTFYAAVISFPPSLENTFFVRRVKVKDSLGTENTARLPAMAPPKPKVPGSSEGYLEIKCISM